MSSVKQYQIDAIHHQMDMYAFFLVSFYLPLTTREQSGFKFKGTFIHSQV